MKVLILGGTGAIGLPLIKILEARGDNVVVTSRSKEGTFNKTTFIKLDAKDLRSLKHILNENWDCIIDFMIYEVDEFKERLQLLLSSTKQYFFLSSATEFSDEDSVITEQTPRLYDVTKDQEFLKSQPYPIRKAICENILRESGAKNWTIVRPYITFNSNRLQLGCFEKEEWLWRCLNGGMILFGKDMAECLTTMTFADDVALAISKLIGNSKAFGEDFTLVSKQSIKWSEILSIYLKVIERETGIKPEVKWTEESLNLRFRYAQYQAKYDRLYNRKFDNSKLVNAIPDLKFSDIDEKLDLCLTKFLATQSFRKIPAPYYSRLAKSYVPIKNVKGIKNKLIHLWVRFMPYPMFKKRFQII